MPSPVAPPTSQSSRRNSPLPQPISMTCLPAIAHFSAASRAKRLANALKMPEKCWDSSKLVEYPITASSKMWWNRKPQESQQTSSKSLRDKARAASAVSRRMQLWIGIDGTRCSIRATAAEHEGQTLRARAPEGLPEVANYDPEVEALRPVSQAQKYQIPACVEIGSNSPRAIAQFPPATLGSQVGPEPGGFFACRSSLGNFQIPVQRWR